ncbi:hypothetical protein ONZ45_g5438 [Pleurotus djamor]|nr:hypothetical protein ONZ45_g5438 [Pleurotus djamor]
MVENARWTASDEDTLVHFLYEHKSEAGDGGNFKKPTFVAASALLTPLITIGGPKPWKSCSSKWSHLRSLHKVILKIKSQSGWATWNDETGASVTPAQLSSWNDFVKRNAKASQFKNKGWRHLQKVDEIIPSPATGANVFYPAAAAAEPPPSPRRSPSWGELHLRDSQETVEPTFRDSESPPPTQDESTDDVEADREDQVPTPSEGPSQPLSTPTEPPAPAATPAPKRRYPASLSQPVSAKRVRSSGASSLHSIDERLGDFNDIMRSLLSADSSTSSTATQLAGPSDMSSSNMQLSPVRKQRAIEKIQMEEGLGVVEKAVMIDIFQDKRHRPSEGLVFYST